MKKQIIYTVCAAALLSSCHIYKSYDRPDNIDTAGLYRDTVSDRDTLVSDTANMGNLPWRDVFRDPALQALIERGLQNNVDLQTAELRVKQARASLLSARLAYAPSFALAPEGAISSFNHKAATKTYQLPAVASWEIDLFGRLLNAKRGAKAALMQTEAYSQAVRSLVIANIANAYYTLLMLDEQLAITEETAAKWRENVTTMRAMKEGGMVNEAAVAQSAANSYMVEASIPDLRRQVRETENALSLILGEAPRRIERGSLFDQSTPRELSAGIPLQLLSNRPDVKAAEMALASAYYLTNEARSAFYPHISLSGTVGWTNNAGTAIVNPGKLIASAVGSLTQPLFNRGANIARLKIAKAQQEEARLNFQQTLLDAGGEVSNALYQFETAEQKSVQREKQVEALETAVVSTRELLLQGTANYTYLEVLTAEQSLLSARISQIADDFERLQAVVNLYQALGGGRN